MSANLIIKKDKELIEKITKTMLVHDNEAYVTSNQLAKYFGIKHKNILRDIRNILIKLDDDIMQTSRLKFEPRNRISRGKNYPYFELNSKAFSLLVMGYNSKRALNFKVMFINAFDNISMQLIQIKLLKTINQDNEKWLEHREINKQHRKHFTDSVKSFVTYAKSQGSKGADNYYKLITNLINNTLPKQNYKNKDSLTHFELYYIENLELKVATYLNQEIKKRDPYKKIFKELKVFISKHKENDGK